MRNWVGYIGILGALTIVLGAIGAHTLRHALSEVQLNSFATGVRYQMWHVFAMMLTVLLSKQFSMNLSITLWLFAVGTLFFSGSIFLLSTVPVHGMENLRALGPATPIGGLILVAGWLSLAVQFIRRK